MKIELDTETDFTMSKLVGHLNKVIKTKISGEPFTVQDVQGYIRKGFPSRYGNYKIKQIDLKEEIGVRIFRFTKQK